MRCAKAEGAGGLWIHANPWAQRGQQQGTCCATLSATTAITPTTLSLGQPDALGGFTPAQWQEQCIFLCACQLALLSWAEQHSGFWLFPLTGVQALWEQATPRTYLAASSSLCAALSRKSLSSPYSTCCCCCREKRCCQSFWPGSVPLASLQLHLKAVGPCGFGGICGGMAGHNRHLLAGDMQKTLSLHRF